MRQSDGQSGLMIVRADYEDNRDMEVICMLLDAYSQDPMGNGRPLEKEILEGLKRDFREIPGACTMIAYEIGEGGSMEAVGLINAFMGYSTFKASPLMNIHDIVVLPGHRGKQIGERLIEAIVEEAASRGCCKVTLEVRTDNPAERLYRRLGFADGNQPMLFLTREI